MDKLLVLKVASDLRKHVVVVDAKRGVLEVDARRWQIERSRHRHGSRDPTLFLAVCVGTQVAKQVIGA